jgi:hypothetical protein
MTQLCRLPPRNPSVSGFTLFSIASIVIAAVVFHVRWTRRTSAIGPTILTTLGIFFCFAGIAWG